MPHRLSDYQAQGIEKWQENMYLVIPIKLVTQKSDWNSYFGLSVFFVIAKFLLYLITVQFLTEKISQTETKFSIILRYFSAIITILYRFVLSIPMRLALLQGIFPTGTNV